jgi:phosphohistidine swiveling domain-containing protein
MAAETTTVVPVDEFVREELYPGYTPAFGTQPFVAEPVRPFQAADNRRFWFRDSLHFGTGMVPASIALLDDAQTWGTQLGAEIVGVPPTYGMVNRLAGTHVFLGALDVSSPWQIASRAERFTAYVAPILQDFEGYWGRYKRELEAGFAHFDPLPLAGMESGELWGALQDAYAFHRRGWYIHFEVMYALVANYLAFYGLAVELGLDPSLVSRYLAGRPTTYIETDEQLWKLAARARQLGVAQEIQRGEPSDARRRLEATPDGARWWREFDEFLQVYGWRTEETCTMDTPSWIEDPGPPLYTIAAYLAKPEGHDFGAALSSAVAERDELLEQARSHIGGGPSLERFEEALATNQAANFAWWNDEHNYLLDRRIQIPIRRLTLELGARLVDDGRIKQPEDLFYVFKAELFRAMDGDGSEWAQITQHIPDRRDFYEHWKRRGPELPAVLGTVPAEITDPLMIEVFGLSPHFLEVVKEPPSAGRLAGFPASKGIAEGPARVLTTVADMQQIQPGEILVCGGTTTEWTPVFGIIEGCVCDTGGSLSHAAIVSREYGVPCVVGTGTATATIRTGDRLRVDGGRGTVELTE